MPACTQPHFSPKEYVPQAPLPEGVKSRVALQPRYRRDHCVTMNDMLHQGLDYSILKNTDGSNTTKHHQVRDLRQLAKQIGWEFLTTLLDEMIATGDHYQLPNRNHCLLRICAAPDSLSAKRLSLGRYQMVDPLGDARTYEFRFEFKRYRHRGKRNCRVDLRRYYQLCKLVNQNQVSYDLN